MARRKKVKKTKQLLTVGLLLIAVQIAYIYLYPRQKPLSAKESISRTLAGQKDQPPRRKEQLRIQLAIGLYKEKNKKLPQKLEELVPAYLDSIPQDPDTEQPFTYSVRDGRYFLGESTGAASSSSAADNTIPAVMDDDTVLSPQMTKALVDSMDTKGNVPTSDFVYDPTGKRDPFKPFDLGPAPDADENKTPLERYDISQLKLTAIIGGGTDTGAATLEDEQGKGYLVKKGVKIGRNNGQVVEIKPDSIMILESTVDFTGQTKTKTIEMRLRTKDQEERRKGKQ